MIQYCNEWLLFISKLIFNEILFLLFLRIDDVIRCFCNLPRCVSTGYMCQTARSSSGGCFSELRSSDAGDSVPKHGCIEILQEECVHFCSNAQFWHFIFFSISIYFFIFFSCSSSNSRRTNPQCDNAPRKYGKAFDDSLILCCYEDMCNGHDQKRFHPNFTADIDGKSLRITSELLTKRSIHSKFGVLNSFLSPRLEPLSPWVPQSVRLLMYFSFVGVRKLR